MAIDNFRTRLTDEEKQYLDELIEAGYCNTISEAIRGIVEARMLRDRANKELTPVPRVKIRIRTETSKKPEVSKTETPKKTKKTTTKKTEASNTETPKKVKKTPIKYFDEKPKSDVDPDVLKQLRKEGKDVFTDDGA